MKVTRVGEKQKSKFEGGGEFQYLTVETNEGVVLKGLILCQNKEGTGYVVKTGKPYREYASNKFFGADGKPATIREWQVNLPAAIQEEIISQIV